MSWIDGLRHRVHTVLNRAAYEREKAEERRFHREMERAYGRAAPVRGGPPDLDPSAGGGWTQRIETVRQDLGYAIRGLARAPGFTALAVLTLALGVGANGAVFSLLDRLFGQAPPGLEEPEGLRRLYIRMPDHPSDPRFVYPVFSYPAFSAVDEAAGGDVAAWRRSAESTVRLGVRSVSARTSYVTPDYFAVLGVGAARGRLFGSGESGVEVPRPVAVISHAFWERALRSDPGIVGRSIQVESADLLGRSVPGTRTTVTVIGVADRGFAGLELGRTDVFIHLGMFPNLTGVPWYEWAGGSLFRAVARLPDGADAAPLEARATAAYRSQELAAGGAGSTRSTAEILATPIVEARGAGRRARPAAERQAIAVSVRVAGVSVILLLIACGNVAGLLLVRAARRRREISVRLALGVSRIRLASQLLVEGLVLATVSAAASVLLALWGGGLLRRLLFPDVTWADAVVDSRTVAVAVASALGMGLVAALAPALGARRVDVAAGLKVAREGGGPPRSAARSALLAGQAALSVVLLIGAGLFVRSLGNVSALRLGFDVEGLAWVDPGHAPDAYDLRAEIAARLRSLPGVRGTALARYAPMLGNASQEVFLPGVDSLPGPLRYPGYNTVSPDFFEVTGMRLLEGRTFEAEEATAVIVTESLAGGLWPTDPALGQCLIVGERDAPCLEVVGVVEDSRTFDVLEEGPSHRYFLPPIVAWTGGTILVRVEPRQWPAIAAAARRESARHFEPGGVRMALMSESLEPQLRPWRLGAQLFTAYGALALLVTVVGVYSVMAYAVSQRTHEMGVRIALGARLGDVLSLVVGEGLRIVALGVVAGTLVALAAGRLVASLLYGVTPRDPAALTAAATVLLITGSVASLVPAWRAGRTDPSDTLRQE